MGLQISTELEAQLRKRAEDEGISVEAYIERLVRRDEEWQQDADAPLPEDDMEVENIRTAVTEGLEQAAQGMTKPAAEVFAELRAQHGIPS